MKKIIIIIVLIILAVAGYFVYRVYFSPVCCAPEREDASLYRENALKTLFAEKYKRDFSEITIEIHKEDGDYVLGGVTFGEEGFGGGFLAVKDDGYWKLVYDGNGSIPCSDIEPYEFPVDMVPECYDQENDKVIER